MDTGSAGPDQTSSINIRTYTIQRSLEAISFISTGGLKSLNAEYSY